eukprot:gene6258-6977_t
MDKDIELDSESMQADMSSTQTVRKSIALKLKKPKVKAKSTKSSKSKKEKKTSSSENKEVSDEAKGRRSPKKSKPFSVPELFPKNNGKEVDWNHKIMAVGEKVQDPLIHICENCTLPILVYGRLSACKHVFCLTCAEKSNGQCSRCGDRIDRIEPVGIGQIFVCSFGGSRHGISGCRRSYLSQRDLLAHVRHRHQKDGIPNSDADVTAKRLTERVQQTANVPYLGTNTQQFTPAMIRPNFAPPPQQAPQPPVRMPIDNRMMPAGMPPPSRDQMVFEGQRIPMMQQFPPVAPSQQFQSMAQAPFRQDQAMLQRRFDEASRNAAAVDQFLASSNVAQFAPSSRPAPMNLPPNPMQFAGSTGRFMQPGLQQQAAMPPQQRIDTNMHQLGQMEGVQMGRAPPVDGGWQGVPPQDWGANQRGGEIPGAFSRTF